MNNYLLNFKFLEIVCFKMKINNCQNFLLLIKIMNLTIIKLIYKTESVMNHKYLICKYNKLINNKHQQNCNREIFKLYLQLKFLKNYNK